MAASSQHAAVHSWIGMASFDELIMVGCGKNEECWPRISVSSHFACVGNAAATDIVSPFLLGAKLRYCIRTPISQ